MIFRQLFDTVPAPTPISIASRHGGEALIIDPVLEKVDRYLQLVRELDLKLVKAVGHHICTPTTSPDWARCATALTASRSWASRPMRTLCPCV